MANAGLGLPPLGKISMIGIWIETVLYGTNCVMYGVSMFILLREGKTATPRRLLALVSTILFLLCTVHVGASLQQLLDAFIYAPPGMLDYSTTYWLDHSAILRILKDNLHFTVILALNCILIWRLYVVFLYNWRLAIFPTILMIGCAGLTYAFLAISARGIYGSETSSLLISAWVLESILIVSINGAIVTRLWWMGRTIASLTSTSTNRFASPIYLIVESGTIAMVLGFVVLALFISRSPALSVAFDVISQLAALTSLLIIVQAAKTSRYHVSGVDFSKTITTTQDEIRFRVGIPREQDSQPDLSLHAIETRSSDSA